MTRKQFDNKVRGFIWLCMQQKGVDLGEKFVKDSIYEFYGEHRAIPRLYLKGTTFGMALPEGYDSAKAKSVVRGMPEWQDVAHG